MSRTPPPRVKRGVYLLRADINALDNHALYMGVKPSRILDEAIRREVRRLLRKERRCRKPRGMQMSGINAAAATLGRKGGQARTERKATASRANGLKGGDGRKNYYILSGEGGTREGPIYTTIRGIRARLTRERGGDRHASAWELVPECATHIAHVVDIDTGAMRDVPEV